ncbi:cytochrome c biogenesis protein CcdA [Patulibacter sp. NPDC049589]|uniref:cytochrome c biogenesis CcdA family protein n=1 Tax=Patulibacter sp. NPDC049589 TaxID=3154731 RepID=UPI0034216DF2
MTAASPTVFAAFAAGMLSFASPCVLPLVPGYLSVLTGGQTVRTDRARVGAILGPAAVFCLSFTLVFVLLGLLATGLSAPLRGSRDTLDVVAGVMLMTMGALYLVTALIPTLGRTFRPTTLIERAGTGGPVLAGMAFAVAWTPCAGPILGAILTAAATQSGVGGGAFLLMAYGIGLSVPFLAAAFALQRVTRMARVVRDHYTAISVVGGVLLLAIGWLVAHHQMTMLASETRDVLSALRLDGVLRVFER